MNSHIKTTFLSLTISFVCVIVLFVTVSPMLANGQVTTDGLPGGGGVSVNGPSSNAIVPLKNPLQVNSISGLLESFLEVASYLLVLFGVLMIIWVGFEFILARGNSIRISELKKQLLYVVIGLAVVIGARIIVSVVINTLQATGTLSPGVTNSIQKAASGN